MRALFWSQLVIFLSLAPMTWYGPVLFGNEKAHHQSMAKFAGIELQSSRYMTDLSVAASGEYVSNKPPGFPLLMMPGYLLLQGVSQLDIFRLTEDLEFRCLKLINLAFCSLLFSLMVLLGNRYARFQLSTSYLVGFGTIYATLILPYSTLLVSHVASALFVVAAFFFALKHNNRPTPGSGFLGMLFASFSCVIDYSNVFAVLPSIFLLLRQSFRSRTLAWSLAGGALSCLVLGLYNVFIFGKLFTLSYSTLQPVSYVAWPGVIGSFANNPFPNFFAFLFSKSRGILVLHPILFLSLAGIWLSYRKGFDLVSKMALYSFVCPVLALSFYLYWHGGNSVGARHILVAIPFLFLFLGPVVESEKWRPIFAAFLIVSMVTALLAYWIQLDDIAIRLTWLEEPRNIHGSFYQLLVPVALSGTGPKSLLPFPFLCIYFLVLIPALHALVYRRFLMSIVRV